MTYDDAPISGPVRLVEDALVDEGEMRVWYPADRPRVAFDMDWVGRPIVPQGHAQPPSVFSSGTFTAVALSPRDVTTPDHLKRALAEARLGIGSGVVAVENGGRETVLPVPAARAHRVDALVAWLLAEQVELAIGIGSPGVTAERGVRESLACARLARTGARGSRAIFARELGVMSFLLAMEDPSHLAEFVEGHLGQLVRDERSGPCRLVETPRAFLVHDGHHLTIARVCHIHTSTVKYRLARLAEVLGRPLHDPNVRFELRMAVEIADFLTELEIAPSLEDQVGRPSLLAARG